MLIVKFADAFAPEKGAAIYEDTDASAAGSGPLLTANWDVWHRLIMELQAKRDERDVLLMRVLEKGKGNE